MLCALAMSASVLDLALGQFRVLPIKPTVLALLMFGGTAFLAILADLLSTSRGRRIIALLKHNAPAQMPYLMVACTSLLLAGLPDAFWGDRGKWIFLVSYGFIISVSSSLCASLASLRGPIRAFLQLPLLMLLGSMFYELNYPGYFSTEESRPAGFAGNSNFGALVANMLCSAVLGYKGSKGSARDLTWLMVTSLGVLITQSRSGLVGFLVLLIVYFFSYLYAERGSISKILKICLGLSLAISISYVALFTIVEHSGLFQSRKTRLDNILGSGRVDDGSSDSRLLAAQDAMRRIGNAPILGHGTGHSRFMSTPPHNLYLQQWVNNGVMGVGFYLLTLFGALYIFFKHRYRPGQAFIAVTMVGGLFSHNILEQNPFLIIFGILLTDCFNTDCNNDEKRKKLELQQFEVMHAH